MLKYLKINPVCKKVENYFILGGVYFWFGRLFEKWSEYLELEDEEFAFSERASISFIPRNYCSLRLNLMIKLKEMETEKPLSVAIPKKTLSA